MIEAVLLFCVLRGVFNVTQVGHLLKMEHLALEVHTLMGIGPLAGKQEMAATAL